MQKDTKEKSLAVRKADLENLLTEAVEHHNYVETARSAVANAQQVALFHAWQAGIRLNEMKKLVGHGNWQSWFEINFCKPFGVSDRTARLYMKIDTDNAHLRNRPPSSSGACGSRDHGVRPLVSFGSPEAGTARGKAPSMTN